MIAWLCTLFKTHQTVQLEKWILFNINYALISLTLKNIILASHFVSRLSRLDHQKHILKLHAKVPSLLRQCSVACGAAVAWLGDFRSTAMPLAASPRKPSESEYLGWRLGIRLLIGSLAHANILKALMVYKKIKECSLFSHKYTHSMFESDIYLPTILHTH